ncbi:hypothetical protein GCM10010324_10150 [Streptomyces hiroshimensis]|uniref:Integral membrane protein n=1 Tax=Streptomyces hiroshimensis TaxID=66424 RepID=A0ABQ2Y679_9ACTN|nr:hypothetical protein GCM10010324_10150 [Streptomyces hiroshimensis]
MPGQAQEEALTAKAPPVEALPADTPGLALELLVHGVGGATPQAMLGDPRTERVTGDGIAGIHRRVADLDAETHPGDHRGEPVREAYVWSNLTSGDGSRALWLMLLPFMVINLAHWMRPTSEGRARTVRAYGLLVRLVALTLTVLLTAAACEVALDLTAWQCAGTHACSSGKAWLGFMSADRGGWWSPPGRRLALAAAVPTALTGLLWLLSRRTWSAYEAQVPARAGSDEDTRRAGGRPALCLPGFWYGRRIVARLRAAHTAAALLTVAAFLAQAASRYDRAPGGSAVLDALGWALDAVLAAAAVFVVHAVCRRGRSEGAPDDTLDRFTVAALPFTTLGLLLLAAVYAAWDRPGWQSHGVLPGDRVFGLIALGQGALVLFLALAARRLHRAAPVERTPLGGLAGPAVATLACALGGVMTAGVAQRVADWLDGPATPGMGDGPIGGPPVLLTWQASVIPPLLAALLLLLVVLVTRTLRLRERLCRTVPDGYPGERHDRARTRAIAGTVARAGLTDAAPWVLGTVAALTLLLGGGAVAGAWSTHDVPGRAASGTARIVEDVAQTAQALGSWCVGLGFVLLLAWGRRAYRDPAARRTVGILWDVGTFWPRAAHPFAPPCYAERAVPDLTWRMRTWTERTGGRLVISGHSQGSVLAAAAVWQLPAATRGRVALLTYGSPLERLYGRWFPAYFGPVKLAALHDDIHCWCNLWRLTDPIGGPVRLPGEGTGATAVDRGPLKDPLAYGRTAEHPLPAAILGHSHYQSDPEFARTRAALLTRLAAWIPVSAQGSAGRSSA